MLKIKWKKTIEGHIEDMHPCNGTITITKGCISLGYDNFKPEEYEKLIAGLDEKKEMAKVAMEKWEKHFNKTKINSIKE